MKKLPLPLLLAAVALSGCVTGTRVIDLPPPTYSSEKSASGPIYISTIEDNRSFEQKPRSPSTPSVKGNLSSTSKEQLATLIGRQRNGYGAAKGDVALPSGKTVQSTMRALLTEGLESRGYQVVDDENAARRLSVSIEKFWAWFSPGMWSVSFESALDAQIDLEQASGKESFNVTGSGLNKGQMASDANWALSYQRGFENFLQNLDEIMDSKGL